MEEEDVTLTLTSSEPDALDEAEDFESIFSPKPRENPVYIDDLPDAIIMNDDGNPMLVVGKDNRIVMERWYEGRWLGTAIYTVRSINQLSGHVALHDDSKQQAAQTNFISARRQGWRFKQTIPHLNLNKREAPRPVPTRSAQEPSQPELDDSGQPLPKRIGRPKGSKNRSAAEIAADNAVKAQEKRAKKEARLARKAR